MGSRSGHPCAPEHKARTISPSDDHSWSALLALTSRMNVGTLNVTTAAEKASPPFWFDDEYRKFLNRHPVERTSMFGTDVHAASSAFDLIKRDT